MNGWPNPARRIPYEQEELRLQCGPNRHGWWAARANGWDACSMQGHDGHANPEDAVACTRRYLYDARARSRLDDARLAGDVA